MTESVFCKAERVLAHNDAQLAESAIGFDQPLQRHQDFRVLGTCSIPTVSTTHLTDFTGFIENAGQQRAAVRIVAADSTQHELENLEACS